MEYTVDTLRSTRFHHPKPLHVGSPGMSHYASFLAVEDEDWVPTTLQNKSEATSVLLRCFGKARWCHTIQLEVLSLSYEQETLSARNIHATSTLQRFPVVT